MQIVGKERLSRCKFQSKIKEPPRNKHRAEIYFQEIFHMKAKVLIQCGSKLIKIQTEIVKH